MHAISSYRGNRPTNSGQIVGERGGTAFPFRFWRGNAVPLAYTTAVGGRGGTWRTPRPLHHQLKSKYGQFFARKSQVLLHSSDTTLLLRYRLIAVGVTYIIL